MRIRIKNIWDNTKDTKPNYKIVSENETFIVLGVEEFSACKLLKPGDEIEAEIARNQGRHPVLFNIHITDWQSSHNPDPKQASIEQQNALTNLTTLYEYLDEQTKTELIAILKKRGGL